MEIQSVEILDNGPFGNCYKVIWTNGKGSIVPFAQDNKDYQAVQQWIADGGTVIDNSPE